MSLILLVFKQWRRFTNVPKIKGTLVVPFLLSLAGTLPEGRFRRDAFWVILSDALFEVIKIDVSSGLAVASVDFIEYVT